MTERFTIDHSRRRSNRREALALIRDPGNWGRPGRPPGRVRELR